MDMIDKIELTDEQRDAITRSNSEVIKQIEINRLEELIERLKNGKDGK